MAALGLTAPQTATAVAGSRPASGAKMVWSISYGRLALQCLAFVFAVGMFESADLSSSLTPMSAFHKKMWADGIALHDGRQGSAVRLVAAPRRAETAEARFAEPEVGRVRGFGSAFASRYVATVAAESIRCAVRLTPV